MKNYIYHLKKISSLKSPGSKTSLIWEVILYNFNFVFNRPLLTKLFRRNIYKNKKKLLYTIITGTYDHLNEIPNKMLGWDYICYTDNPNLTSDSWEIRLLEESTDLDSVRKSRHYKINNHLIDQNYYVSIYIDANIKIRGNLDSFLIQALPKDAVFSVLLHPFSNSLEQELHSCIKAKKDDDAILRKQYNYYTTKCGFKDETPHINARLLIRKTGDKGIRQTMEVWFDQLLKWSRRDQMAFNYAYNKSSDLNLHYVPYWIFRAYFKKLDHKN